LLDGSIQISDLKLNIGELSEVIEEIEWLVKIMDLYDKIGIPHSYASNNSEDGIIDYLDTLYKVFIKGEYDKVKLPSNPVPGILLINLGIYTFRFQCISNFKNLFESINPTE